MNAPATRFSGRAGAFSAFAAVVAVYCIWVMSLPLFPTQDGAVHLYYTSVLGHLLSGSSLFSSYFTVRHPLPPYMFHYAALLFLERMFPVLLAEQILVCLFLAAFTFGFRFLAQGIGVNGTVLSVWAIPLALNWPLGMGFLNYCFSVAFSLWAMGAWLRAVQIRTPRRWIVFLLIAVLMLFTHPVPLLLVLAFVGGELALRMIQAERRFTFSLYRTDLLVAVLASCSLLYIALFVDRGKTAVDLQEQYSHKELLLHFLRLIPLSFITGNLFARLCRFALYAMLAGALTLAAGGLRSRWRARKLGPADLLLLGGAVLAVMLPLLPRSINGADFFSDRLLVFVWIAILASAASGSTIPRSFHMPLITAGCLYALFVLFAVDRQVRPTAHNIARIETAPVNLSGQTGMFIDTLSSPKNAALTFDPYLWVAARYFRRTGDVLLNSPWLESPILPLAPTEALLSNHVEPKVLNSSQRLEEFLLRNSEVRQSIAARVRTAVLIGTSPPLPSSEPLLAQLALRWTCNQNGWYSVCQQ